MQTQRFSLKLFTSRSAANKAHTAFFIEVFNESVNFSIYRYCICIGKLRREEQENEKNVDT